MMCGMRSFPITMGAKRIIVMTRKKMRVGSVMGKLGSIGVTFDDCKDAKKYRFGSK